MGLQQSRLLALPRETVDEVVKQYEEAPVRHAYKLRLRKLKDVLWLQLHEPRNIDISQVIIDLQLQNDPVVSSLQFHSQVPQLDDLVTSYPLDKIERDQYIWDDTI